MAARTPEVTYRIMSAVKQKDTEPELMLRKALWHRGLRYRKNYRKLPGRPDIVFMRAKLVVFCDGDFWHGHNWAIRGLSSLEEELEQYSDFWKAKILGNLEHDKKVNFQLAEMGWRVLRVWESDIRKDLNTCVELVVSEYQRSFL